MKNKIRSITLVYFLLFLGLGLSNKASALDFFGIDILSAEPNYCDTSFRKNAAFKMANYFEEMNDAIPNISPSEENWLNLELKSQNNQRVQHALRSDEYNMRELKKYTQQNHLILKKIFEGQFPNEESFLWLMFIKNNLKEAGNFHLIQLNSKLPEVVQKYGNIWWCDNLNKECYVQALTVMTGVIATNFAMPATGQDPTCKS